MEKAIIKERISIFALREIADRFRVLMDAI